MADVIRRQVGFDLDDRLSQEGDLLPLEPSLSSRARVEETKGLRAWLCSKEQVIS